MRPLLTRLTILILAIIIALPISGSADDKHKSYLRNNLPQLLGASNVGTEFFVTFHPCWETANLSNDLKLYISSGTKTLVTVEVAGKGIFYTKYTVPNDIIEFTLKTGEGQCYSKTDRQKPLEDQVFEAFAVRISSKDPIIVYGVTRYQYTSDGFLALPTSSLGKEYIIASYADPTDNNIQWLPAYTSIIGIYDNTKVRFTMGGTLYSKTSGGLSPGESKLYTLNTGDVLLVAGLGAFADLSGSKVVANKNVSVISGNFCAYIPSEFGYCDFIIEQDLPTNTWGNKYHVSRMINRLKNSICKIFAKEPKTEVKRNGRVMGKIANAGGVEGTGYWFIRYDDKENLPWVWSSDMPISITQYNPGQSYDGIVSDPFQLVLTPMEQYQTEITFNTPGIRGGYGYPDNFINIVYRVNENGFMPDDFEFAKVTNSQFEWRQLNAIDPIPGYKFDDDEIVDRPYYSKTLKLPGDGVYKLRSSVPFAAYAYGFSSYDSYGFPTSVALADLERPDTVPPDPTWSMKCGDIEVAEVKDMPDEDDIRSNMAFIYFDTDSSFNYIFENEEFEVGTTRTVKWSCRIQDASKDAYAVITFADRRGNDTTLRIYWYAPKFIIEPDLYDFGRLEFGSSKEYQFNVVNIGNGPMVVSTLELKDNNQNFELFDYTLPKEIQAGEKMPFKVRFNAVEVGDDFRDSIGVGDTCVFKNLALVKAKVGSPLIDANDYNWNDVKVGTAIPHTFTIKNDGSSELRITGFSGPFLQSPDNVFRVETGLTNITPATPLVIPAGTNKQFSVSFTPTDQKRYKDSIVFHSNAKATDSVSILEGRGILGDLTANYYDWGKRRIHRPAIGFPVNPYPTDNAEQVIELRNDGSDEVFVEDIIIKSDIKGTAFKFDRDKFRSLKVPAKSTVYVPVTFQPTELGQHELVFSYKVQDLPIEPETYLRGFGISPKIETFDMDFGTTIKDDFTNIQTRTIRFTNIRHYDANAQDVSDSLTIERLQLAAAGAISTDGTNWGTEGFRFDLTQVLDQDGTPVTFPAVLQPDEYIEITADFVANKPGNHRATVTSIDDADNQDVTSVWTGSGIVQGIFVTGGSSNICVHEIEIITCRVENNGAEAINVTSVALDPDLAVFTLQDANQSNGFTMAPGDVVDIPVVYSPTSPGTMRTEIVIKTDAVDPEYQEIRADVEGTAVYYQRSTTSAVSQTSVVAGESFDYSVNLSAGEDLSMANVKEFSLKMRYKKDFVLINLSTIKIGTLLDGKFNMNFDIQTIDPDNNIDEITFTYTAIGNNFLQGSGQIVSARFNSFLPWYAVTDPDTKIKEDTVTFSYDIAVIGSRCLDISNSVTSVELMPTCVNTLRNIKISGVNYSFMEIVPNPVGSNGGKMRFDLGLDGYTELTVYSAAGELKEKLFSQDMKAGSYIVDIPVDKLTSGAYMCVLTSGEYREQRTLIVRK